MMNFGYVVVLIQDRIYVYLPSCCEVFFVKKNGSHFYISTRSYCGERGICISFNLLFYSVLKLKFYIDGSDLFLLSFVDFVK
jgi:hypothetical protein